MHEAPILIYPGEHGPFAPILDVLETQHAQENGRRQRVIDECAANGAPTDGLALLPAFKRDPALEGVLAEFVVLAERERRTLAGKVGKAWSELGKALEAKDDEAIAAATNALFDARSVFIQRTTVSLSIYGQVFDVKDPATLELLDRNHLQKALHDAADAFQDLGPKKAYRSGSSLGSTLGASSAPSAPSIGDAIEAATAARSSQTADPRSSPAPDTRPTPAPGGT